MSGVGGVVTIEACVTSIDEARAAVGAGAERLELCRHLEVGGLTPSVEDVSEMVATVAVPVFAMVRPRAGDFRARAGEVGRMLDSIDALGAAGASGFVLGLLDDRGTVDAVAVAELVRAAGSRPVTFHRAFDDVRDRLRALEQLAASGVRRVLTSGGGATAWDGRAELRRMVDAASPGITILAGGSVRGDHVRALVGETGVAEVHARAAGVAGVCRALRATA